MKINLPNNKYKHQNLPVITCEEQIDFDKLDKTVKELHAATREMNLARNELREAASALAGTELRDWKFDDIVEYVELGFTYYKSL